MGKTMKIHPVLIVFSLLAGSEIAGFVGIILAVPISILIQEIFSYLSILKSSNLKNIPQA
jgi:predicted PurR-regulated permease PerM